MIRDNAFFWKYLDDAGQVMYAESHELIAELHHAVAHVLVEVDGEFLTACVVLEQSFNSRRHARWEAHHEMIFPVENIVVSF